MPRFNLTKMERDDMIAAMKSADSNIDRPQDETTSLDDEPLDYYGAYGDYEDYEPSPYDGTYSEM